MLTAEAWDASATLCPMRPAEMTTPQHARLLHGAYLEDRRSASTGSFRKPLS